VPRAAAPDPRTSTLPWKESSGDVSNPAASMKLTRATTESASTPIPEAPRAEGPLRFSKAVRPLYNDSGFLLRDHNADPGPRGASRVAWDPSAYRVSSKP